MGGRIGTMNSRVALDTWTLWKRSKEGKTFLGNTSEFSDSSSPLCINWELFERLAEKDRELASAMLVSALQAFMVAPDFSSQEYTTPGDFPEEFSKAMSLYSSGGEAFDMVWRELFEIKDYTNSGESGFKSGDLTSALTFRKVPHGDKISVYFLVGTEGSVQFSLFGGALGWDRTWFEDREYVKIADIATEFKNAYYNQMAKTHYELIDALPASIDQAWAQAPGTVVASDPFYESLRDLRTINTACSNIMTALEAKGIDIGVEERFFVLAPFELRQRIGSALVTNYRPPGTGKPERVNYSVMPVYTKLLAATDKYYVALPKRKVVTGIRKRLEVISDFDMLTNSDVTAAWGRYGAVIAEKDQFRRCDITGEVGEDETEPQYTQELEYDISNNPIFIGEAEPGTATNESGWRVRKITYDGSGNAIRVEWASSTDDFDKIWDQRATYVYG